MMMALGSAAADDDDCSDKNHNAADQTIPNRTAQHRKPMNITTIYRS